MAGLLGCGCGMAWVGGIRGGEGAIEGADVDAAPGVGQLLTAPGDGPGDRDGLVEVGPDLVEPLP